MKPTNMLAWLDILGFTRYLANRIVANNIVFVYSEDMMQKRIKQAYGNWVEGDRFWDRESDTELLIEKLDEGAHILLVAQRRMGKTSLMKEIKRQLSGRYTCLFVDLQKASTAEDAIVEISLALKPYKSLWNKTKDLFSNVLNKLAENIEGVNLGEMLGIRGHAELTHYEERLKIVLGPELFTLALEMLTEAAVTGCLTRESLAALQKGCEFGERNVQDASEEILRVLEHDGYIKAGKGGFLFESYLLRDWWKKRYEYFHVPVLERGI